MCSVYSAVSGGALAVLDDYEGKNWQGNEAIFGSSDWSHEIQDDVFFSAELVNVHLVLSEFWPPEPVEDDGRRKDDCYMLGQ